MPSFASEGLRVFARDVFIACNTPEDVAEEVATALILADLSGHPSHGVIRIPSYIDEMNAGRVVPGNRVTEISRTATAVLLDANWGFGHPAAAHATREVAAMALESGIALAGLISLNHVGRLGQWAEQAADLGVILLMFTGGEYTTNTATPFGGMSRLLSTNPMSAAIPSATKGSMILDFATTASAEGKLRVARAKGAQVPPNTILDKHGNPTTDPEDFYDGGMLLPFGAHKGYALSMLVHALGSCLTGAWRSDRANKFGAALIGIDPAVFVPAEIGGGGVDRLFGRMTTAKPAPGFDEVLVPGEPERRSRERYSKEGVELPEATVDALRESGDALGVDTSALDAPVGG
ncbi:MAG: Ldh family oxidoreductase [Chloroflexi bacterium]|nr:Ldh family oxidoreductase [Chloroflexota bacterium]MCY3936768.1 Ldh family oxidoreductase [Chloroflexota bacterium]